MMSSDSANNTIDSFAQDIEIGRRTHSMRDQSRRLSKMIMSRTELVALNPDKPEATKGSSTQEVESSGLQYWIHEVRTAREHGGDYPKRLDTAIRAALGSFIVFGVLIFPQQQILGAVWIGNIFMHCNLKDSLGASIASVQGFGLSILLTTLLSLPVGVFMAWLSLMEASIILPFAVSMLSFFIMSCPQLTARNLMILVMYIVVVSNVPQGTGEEDAPLLTNAPLQLNAAGAGSLNASSIISTLYPTTLIPYDIASIEDEESGIEWWEPLGWAATYWVGLTVAVIMNLVPVNSALQATHGHLIRLEQDLTMLLVQCKAYADNTGRTPGISRAAMASIELLYSRIAYKSIPGLKAKLPATKVELTLRCRPEGAEDIGQWITQAEKLKAHLQMLQTALTQQVLGEEHQLYSASLREAKQIIKEEIGPARDRMVDAMIASVAVCHAWADPFAKRTVLPDTLGELEESLEACRSAFHRAMARAAEKLGENQNVNTPVFAHLTRRMSAFHALFELGECIASYLKQHRWEEEQIKSSDSRSCLGALLIDSFMSFIKFSRPDWLWHKKDSFRLAIKTSVGMFLASLFVSVPYLREIASPFGVWPGLTVASVNLGNTGSSFHKASDRLFGTLLAAAYALLVSDLFPGNHDYVKIPAIAVFTFLVVYMRDSEHAYKYTYAATSIGSMLYGSVKNDFDIAGYIPKRIELIFVGVVIFTFVELLLFPRSSRKIVETKGYDFFFLLRDFVKEAAISTQRMEDYVVRTTEDPKYYKNSLLDNPADAFHLKELQASLDKLKAESGRMKAELESGLIEPSMGLSLPLNSESFRGLVKQQGEVVMYGTLLTKALKELSNYFQKDGHILREVDWPHLHTEFLSNTLEKTEYGCAWLKSSFPDGRLRPQAGNSVKAVTAAASFRAFQDVRLDIIAKWSNNYSRFLKEKGLESSDPVAVMTLGVTTTYILEICRHLQKAGAHVETTAHNFPAARANKLS